MTFPLIAVAVDDDGAISSHAGRAQHWWVFAISSHTGDPELVWCLDLTTAGSLHEWHVRGDGNRHPLHAVDVAIAGSGGEGVTRRLAQRQTSLITTTEREPVAAVRKFFSGELPQGLPHDETQCLDPEKHGHHTA